VRCPSLVALYALAAALLVVPGASAATAAPAEVGAVGEPEPPPAHPAPTAEPRPTPPSGTPPETLGAPADFGAADLSEPTVSVPEGAALHELPDPRTAVLAVIDAPSELPVLERKGPWARVRYGSFTGWVVVPGAAGAAGAGGALPPRPADPEVLARALAALPGDDAGKAFGPYTLYTDLDNPKLLARLTRLATDLDGIYRRRYGLDPGSGAGEAVILFSREADYRSFSRGELSDSALEEGGHAGFGVASLFAEGLKDDEVASLLVHELTHLINGRALGPRTSPWLEEGLADDLGDSRIDRVGRLFPGTLGGKASVSWGRIRGPAGLGRSQLTITTSGGYIALGRLVRLLDRGGLPPLAVVTHLSWRQLVDPGGRAVAYAESALFIRYLLDGGDEHLTAAFRRYLVSITEGGDGDAETLRQELGERWEDLDKGFARWLRTVEVTSG
jgi:hypothetical protein